MSLCAEDPQKKSTDPSPPHSVRRPTEMADSVRLSQWGLSQFVYAK